jgi:hypothetical protein
MQLEDLHRLLGARVEDVVGRQPFGDRRDPSREALGEPVDRRPGVLRVFLLHVAAGDGEPQRKRRTPR